jgi:hypothetical protein
MIIDHLIIWASANGRGESLPRFDGHVFVRDATTPFSTASALLEQGLAQPDDMLTMRHAGMQFTRPCNNVTSIKERPMAQFRLLGDTHKFSNRRYRRYHAYSYLVFSLYHYGERL